MRIRSLKQQLNYCITQNCRIGESKRAARRDPNNNLKGQVYSVQTAENLRSTAKSFSVWMRQEHPEIRMAALLRPEHVQSWVDANSKNWTEQTAYNKISQMRTIFIQVNNTYGCHLPPLEVDPPVKVKAHKIRDKRLEKEDFMLLRQEMQNRTTQARYAVEIAYRCGLRAKEIARLHADCINTNKWIIEVREGAKNGKHRDVPIREADRAYFAELKQEKAGDYICKGVQEDSLNHAIRRAMQDIGIADKYPCTSIHAIRKLYATERMGEERKKGLEEREAWSIVQQELGHGSDFRQKLYNTYVK